MSSSASRRTTRSGWVTAAVRLRDEPERRLPGVAPQGLAAPSLAQCTVTGRLVCLQDNLAQEVLYVNKKLMNQFGYKVPKTWQQWAALGEQGRQGASGLHHRHRRATRSAPGCTCGPTSARSRRSWRRRRSNQRDGRPLHADGEACSIRCSRAVGVERDRLHARLREEVRRGDGQDPADAGPDLVRQGPVRLRTLRIPAGEMTAALPLRWNKRAAHDRSGRRRSMGRLQAHEEHGGCRRLREVGNDDERGQGKAGARRRDTRRTGPPPTSG